MKTDQGLIKWIIIIIIALIVLGYYGFSLRQAVQSPTTQDNLSYASQIVSNVWNNYLKAPATYLWNLFLKYIWYPAIGNLLHKGSDQILQQIESSQATATSSSP